MADETLRILCFGDSLTSGYYNGGASSHPYAIAFEAKLRAALPHTTIHVHHNGKPGDVGSWTAFHERLKRECAQCHYDWVIILAGTNDIAYRIPAQDMYEAFQLNWNVPLRHTAKVLALTVPETQAKPWWAVRIRNQLNGLILQHKQRSYYAFDLHAKIPFHSLSDDDKARYWDDGVHLTAQGYDWMGGHIAHGFLAARDSAEQERAAARCRPGRAGSLANDHVVFEEEGGSPGNLSEGYVVVRKRDLH